MKTINEQIVEKQDELIAYLIEEGTFTHFAIAGRSKIISELSELKQQAEQNKTANSDKELYEKVYIRSEADLPKDDKKYIGFHKQSGLIKFNIRKGFFDESWFVQYIDWYLRPVDAVQISNNRQQSEDGANNLKTAEEILKDEMPENLWTFICSYPVAYKSEEKLVEWIIDAMQEYAAQFKAEQEKVTDEILDLQQYVTNCLYFAHFEAQTMLKDEFDEWVEREVNNIAEYLNKEKVTDITDEDIHKAFEKIVGDEGNPYNAGWIQGAIDMRDKKIIHYNK